MTTTRKNKAQSTTTTTPPWPHGPNAPSDGRFMLKPDVASEWLNANRSNRRLKRRAVEKIKKAILSGKWMLNGQTIVFSKSWRLLDGQHRLHAIVAAGIAVEVTVKTGIEDAAGVTIDGGGAGSRSPADAWMIANDIQPSIEVAARVNACWASLTNSMPSDSDEFGIAYNTFIGGIEAVAECFAAHRRALNRASIVAGFAVAWKESPDIVVEMAKRYTSGANLPEKHPMLVLFKWASIARSGGGTGERIAETRKTISLVLDAVHGRVRNQARGKGNETAIERLRKLHKIESTETAR